MNPNPTSNEPPKSSGGTFGGRVWGLWEVIHGLGESIRGTTMGAVDTMTHCDSSKHDTIASQGRAEMQRGLSNLSGRPAQHESADSGRLEHPAPHDPSAVPNEQSTMFAAGNYDQDPNVVQTNTGGIGKPLQDPHMQQYDGAPRPVAPALPPRRRSQGYGTIS